MPDENGVDVKANWDVPLADDFRCTETGPITDIHFWGSWYDNIQGDMHGFWISFWSNDDTEPSHPKNLLWERYIDDFDAVEQDPSLQGWYEPPWGDVDYYPENHDRWWLYTINITEDHLWQEEDTIYWLSIKPDYVGGLWGWKNADREQCEHFMDDAAWGTFSGGGGYDWGTGNPLEEPWEPYYSLDLAFVITTGPSCCNKDWDYWSYFPNLF